MLARPTFCTIFVKNKTSSEIRGTVELHAIVPEIMEGMKTMRFTNSFHASCYQFHVKINAFGKGALQKLSFSSVFEAHASKTCEQPITSHDLHPCGEGTG